MFQTISELELTAPVDKDYVNYEDIPELDIEHADYENILATDERGLYENISMKGRGKVTHPNTPTNKQYIIQLR